MSLTSHPNHNASLASSIVAPHVEFSSLDAETTRLINYCRWLLGWYSLVQLAASIAMMVIMQAFWASDSCATFSAYSTSSSIVCEIGLPLFIFASFGISLLIVMAALGIYAAVTVRRLFVSSYLSLSLGLVLFLAFALTLVVSMKIPFVEFGIAPLVFLIFSVIPVVTSILLLRFKSLDKDADGDARPSYSMMETVLEFPTAVSSSTTAQRNIGETRHDSGAVVNDSILFPALSRASSPLSNAAEVRADERQATTTHSYNDPRMTELFASIVVPPPPPSSGQSAAAASASSKSSPTIPPPQRQAAKKPQDDDEFMSFL